MQSSPDTLWVLLTGFASMAWGTASEYILLDQPEHVWLSWFLQPKWNIVGSFLDVMSQFELINYKFPK